MTGPERLIDLADLRALDLDDPVLDDLTGSVDHSRSADRHRSRLEKRRPSPRRRATAWRPKPQSGFSWNGRIHQPVPLKENHARGVRRHETQRRKDREDRKENFIQKAIPEALRVFESSSLSGPGGNHSRQAHAAGIAVPAMIALMPSASSDSTASSSSAIARTAARCFADDLPRRLVAAHDQLADSRRRRAAPSLR